MTQDEGIALAQDEEAIAPAVATGVHVATTFYMYINSTPPAELAGEIDAMAQDEEVIAPAVATGVHVATNFYLGINSTPPAELVGEIDAMAQDEEVISPAVAIGVQQPQMRLRKWLTDAQRYAAYISLHAKSKNGKLPKTATKEVVAFLQTQI